MHESPTLTQLPLPDVSVPLPPKILFISSDVNTLLLAGIDSKIILFIVVFKLINWFSLVQTKLYFYIKSADLSFQKCRILFGHVLQCVFSLVESSAVCFKERPSGFIHCQSILNSGCQLVREAFITVSVLTRFYH